MSALDHPQVESSLESFLEKVQPRLKVLFAHYRIPPQDTEDILQQALLALIYHARRIRDPEAWLLGTLRNKCLLYWREQRRKLYDAVDAAVLELMAEPLEPGPGERGPPAGPGQRPRAAAGALPVAALALRYRQGYEPPEVAERLGYSPASISKITTRCLAALTRHLVAAGSAGRKTGHDRIPIRPPMRSSSSSWGSSPRWRCARSPATCSTGCADLPGRPPPPSGSPPTCSRIRRRSQVGSRPSGPATATTRSSTGSSRRSSPPSPARRAARRWAASSTEELMQCPAERRHLLLANSQRFRNRMLCERLIEESSRDRASRTPGARSSWPGSPCWPRIV